MGKFKITQSPDSKDIYLYPESNGCVNGCFPIGDIPNWRCVDDLWDALEPETAYVFMEGASIVSELYTMQNHGAVTGTINYVKVYDKAKSDKYPPHINADYKIMISNNSVCSYYARSGNMPLCTGYGSFEYAWLENPWTSVDWTWDDIDNLQAGFECSSPSVVMSPFYMLPTNDGDRIDITNVTTGYEHWEAVKQSKPYAEVFESGAAWQYDLYKFIEPSNDPNTYSDATRGSLFHNNYMFACSLADGLYIHKLNNDNKFEFILRQNDGKTYQSISTDGTYYYVATSTGTYVYSFNGKILTEITNTVIAAQAVYCYGDYIYVGETTNINAYTFNGTVFTSVDTQLVNGNVSGVYHDGSYVYVGTSSGMLYAMSFNGIVFAIIDSDDKAFLLGENLYGIDGDGTYIYAPAMLDGIYAYSFDGVTLTFVAERDDGNTYKGLTCSGGYIFVPTDGANDELIAYTFDGAAFSAIIDTYNFGLNAHTMWEVHAVDGFIICDWTSMHLLTFSGAGFANIVSTAEDNTPTYLNDNIVSVTVVAKMGKDPSADDGADIRGCFTIKTGGNEFDTSADYYTLESKQRYYAYTWTENPDTAAAWTLAEVQALQAGIGLYGTGSKYATCSKCHIVIAASTVAYPEIHTCRTYMKVNYSPDATECWMPKPKEISTNHTRNIKMLNFWDGEREVYDVNRSGKSMVLTGKIADVKGGVVWCDADYAFRKKITIDHTQVDGDLVDFPVYLDVNLDKRCLNANGYDVMFCSNSCSEYSCEIETYTSAGKLKAWVKIPAVSSTVDTVFWIYYRKSGVTVDPSSSAVWDSADYRMTQHMTDNPDNATITGSTDTGHVGTKDAASEPFELNSLLHKAQNFDGIDDEILIPDNADLRLTNPFIVSLWAKRHANGTDAFSVLFTKGSSVNTRNYNLYWANNHTITFRVRDITNGVDRNTHFSGVNDYDVWHHIVGIYDGVNITLYVDGVSSTPTAMVGVPATSTATLKIGRLAYDVGNNEYRFNGCIEEVHVIGTNLGTDWILAEYANQKISSTFVSYGTQQENYIDIADACAQIICIRDMTRDGAVVAISKLNPVYFNGDYRINSFGWNKISEKPENYDWILELESAN